MNQNTIRSNIHHGVPIKLAPWQEAVIAEWNITGQINTNIFPGARRTGKTTLFNILEVLIEMEKRGLFFEMRDGGIYS